MALWANEVDLSFSAGRDQGYEEKNIVHYIQEREGELVVNDFEIIEKFFNLRSEDLTKQNNSRKLNVAIVLDNSGPELIADLCLAECLIRSNKVKKVSFHGKSIPWFISDVTIEDLKWTLDSGLVEESERFKKWSDLWKRRFLDETFIFKTNYFWTLPACYDELKNYPLLCKELFQENDIVIFKGDLNYRKIVGDRKWKPNNPIHKVRAFQALQYRSKDCSCHINNHDSCSGKSFVCTCPDIPMIVSLRVAKSDVAVGLDNEIFRKVSNDRNWWTTGKYGFIQVVSPIISSDQPKQSE